jgi:hypothetical protein
VSRVRCLSSAAASWSLLDQLGRDRRLLEPAGVPVAHVALAGQCLVEQCRRPLEWLLVVPERLEAVDQPPLLDVVEALPRELARVGAERTHLAREPGVVLELREQRVRVLGQARRVAQLFRLDPVGDLRGAVVRVHQVPGMPAEPETQLEVALDDGPSDH